MSQGHEQNNPLVKPNFEALGSEALDAAGLTYQSTEAQTAPTELDALRTLLSASETMGGNFEITPVSDVGYIVRLPAHNAVPGNDWVLFDQDDTLIAYSGAKSVRQKNFEDYAESTRLTLDKAQSKILLDVTDRFSRWQDGDAVMYHLDAHKLALGWATSVLRASPPEDIDAALQSVKLQLESITAQSNDPQASANEVKPFYFDSGKLVSNIETPSENLDGVFAAMIEPPSYDDVLEVLGTLANGESPDMSVNVGIYTYGEPAFQLTKVVKLIEAQAREDKDLPISQIWLTKASKGVFINELVSQLAIEQAETESPQAGRDDALKTELFDETPHVIMLVDDSPKELDGFSGSSKAIFAKTGTHLARMRLIKSDTKSESSDWGLAGHKLHLNTGVGLYDSRPDDSGSLPATIYQYLTSNLSWTISKRFGHSVRPEPALAKRLNKRVESYAKKAEGADFAGGMLLVELDEG